MEEKNEEKKRIFPELPEEDNKLQAIFERLREKADEELLKGYESVNYEMFEDDVDQNEKKKELKK